MSLRPRASARGAPPTFGAASAPGGAATGAFFQSADFNEWERLDQRLTKLEGQLNGTLGGYASFQTEFKALTVNFTALLSRVGEIERKAQELNASITDVKRQQASFETSELGRESRYQNLERQLNRLDDRIRAHTNNNSMHAHDDHDDWKPKGFQANDQPKSFMGGGR
jgi:chromosome segregation ATPase